MLSILKLNFHRWTQNEWQSLHDYRASYVKGSNDVLTDKFEFKIYAPLDLGQSLLFAVRYHCAGQQFWDNNGEENYRFICVSVDKEVEVENTL